MCYLKIEGIFERKIQSKRAERDSFLYLYIYSIDKLYLSFFNDINK